MTPEREQGMRFSTLHPHEPEIPPCLDGEGRCRICSLLVQLDSARADLAAEQAHTNDAESLLVTPMTFSPAWRELRREWLAEHRERRQ